MKKHIGGAVLVSALLAALLWACGDDEENTGASCETATDCYDDIDRTKIVGQIECLDRVEGGYCTHFCTSDADCCAVPGECETGIPQVCAPFENSTQKRCFLSCEAAVVGDREENAYCQEYAHEAFGCRSTGGGNQNRKVCVP
jgi:hypothetical protein